MRRLGAALLRRWTWKMAGRSLRSQGRSLILYGLCIAAGVAALVALRSYGGAVKNGLVEQSQQMLGADVVVKSRTPFSREQLSLLEARLGPAVQEWRLPSMALFPSSPEAPRLVQVRALDPGWPLYGKVETLPAGGWEEVRSSRGACLVEESLLLQCGARPGDTLRLGQGQFRIAGILKSLPGESVMMAELAPRVLIASADLEATALLGFGSRVFHRLNFRLPAGFSEAQANTWLEAEQDRAGKDTWSFESFSRRQENIRKVMDNLLFFLQASGLMALLLGGLGVHGALQVFIRRNLPAAALLRCLGAGPGEVTAALLLQCLALGLFGGLAGVAAGFLLQAWLPSLAASFLPLQVEAAFSPAAALEGILLGLACALFAALGPLRAVWRVSPLDALRRGRDGLDIGRAWQIGVIIALAAIIALYAALNGASPKRAGALALGLLLGLGFLALIAKTLMALLRRGIPSFLPFPWKQGVRNLFRPRNQTVTVTLSLGCGVFLLLLLHLLQKDLLAQVASQEAGSAPNLVLFDVQADQRQELSRLVEEQGVALDQVVPIVDMRLRRLAGKPVAEWRSLEKAGPEKLRRPSWIWERVYRCSYRDAAAPGESLLEGSWGQPWDGVGRIPVSIEEGWAREARVKLGDELDFEVDGEALSCRVTAVRRVEWMQMRPNFFIIFPSKVLEKAPQMQVLVLRSADAKRSAELQKLCVTRFPNVSVLDLSLVVKAVGEILGRCGQAVNFIAAFSLLAGLVVLWTSLLLCQKQRLEEAALLRVIGAERRQLRQMLLAEFTCLGLLAGGGGSLLALGAESLLAQQILEISRPLDWPACLIATSAVVSFTWLAGFWVSRGGRKISPLERLRQPE
ncbi:MAG: hypothetical protein RL095_1272 [Verrucomicrobiota bacterium]|jgi:putative ABC transport system permease protein